MSNAVPMRTLIVALALALVFALGARAEEPGPQRLDHFEGLPSDTLTDALAHLLANRLRLAEALAREPLGVDTLGEVHEITYTLENALERIGIEISTLTHQLEQIHLASERGDVSTTRVEGAAWIEATRPLAGTGSDR